MNFRSSSFKGASFGGTSWAPGFRIAIGGVGAWLLGLSLRERGATRLALTLAGAGLLTRASLNRDFAYLYGITFAPVAALHRTFRIQAPRDQVWEFCRTFSNFPRFMSFVESVEVNDQGGLRWRIRGPMDRTLEWDAQITRLRHEERISWQSLPGSPIMNSGDLIFRPTSDYETTEVEVRLKWAPPAGAVGYAIAHFLGFDPKTRMDDDLMKMKSLIERDYVNLITRRA